jgi:hypothetical protein
MSDLFWPSDRRLSANLVRTFADSGVSRGQGNGSPTAVISVSRPEPYFSFQVAPQLYSRGWVDPVPEPLLLRKSGSARNWTRTSGTVVKNLDHQGWSKWEKTFLNSNYFYYLGNVNFTWYHCSKYLNSTSFQKDLLAKFLHSISACKLWHDTKNINEFTLNSEIHEINTRQQGKFHLPLANLRKYQKGIYYIGTKVYNNLPLYIKAVSNDFKKSEEKLKQFLQRYSFYSLQEYFCYK